MGGLLKAFLVLVGLVALVGVGAYFVLKRPDIPYETLAARYESAASRYIDLPSGVRLHYRDEGQAAGAPTLLLIHGYGASLHTWTHWVRELGETYRIVSIDLPGHGLTRAPVDYQVSIEAYRDLVEEFAAAYGLERFAIAGNSMGGNVSWEYALAHPERLDALILVDASGWRDGGGDRENQPLLFKLLRNEMIGSVLRDIDNTYLTRRGLETAFHDPSLVSDDMVSLYTDLSRAPGHRDILLKLMRDGPDRNFATAERLAPLSGLPVLVLTGAQDNLVPATHASQFNAAIAGSELIVYENVGHVPQEEVAARSAMDVHEFLYRIYEGSALAPEAVTP